MNRKQKRGQAPFLWENREKDLEKVIRYHTFRVMFYRTNLKLHSERVQAIVKLLLPEILSFYPDFDARKAVLIAKYHDDHELIPSLGDIPLQLKLQMGEEQLSELEQREILAAETLADYYGNPTIEGYKYLDLLICMLKNNSAEAQLAKFADKLDAFCEATHEVLAGNTVFIEPMAFSYIMKTFNSSSIMEKFGLIGEVFRSGNGLFHFKASDLKGYFNQGLIGPTPHTEETLRRDSDIPHYEAWKELTLSMPNGLDLLTNQKEFHNIRFVKLLFKIFGKLLLKYYLKFMISLFKGFKRGS